MEFDVGYHGQRDLLTRLAEVSGQQPRGMQCLQAAKDPLIVLWIAARRRHECSDNGSTAHPNWKLGRRCERDLGQRDKLQSLADGRKDVELLLSHQPEKANMEHVPLLLRGQLLL